MIETTVARHLFRCVLWPFHSLSLCPSSMLFYSLQSHTRFRQVHVNAHAVFTTHNRFFFLFTGSQKGQRGLLWLVNCVEFVSWSGNIFLCDHVWSCRVTSSGFLIDCKHLPGHCLFQVHSYVRS